MQTKRNATFALAVASAALAAGQAVRAEVTTTGDVGPLPVQPFSDFYVGNTADGTLTLDDTGAVTSLDTGPSFIGYDAGVVGEATVTGVNAVWTPSSLRVGESGTGSLELTSAGRVTTGILRVGSEANSSGAVNIAGGNLVASTAEIGFDGSGTVDIDGDPLTAAPLSRLSVNGLMRIGGGVAGASGTGAVTVDQQMARLSAGGFVVGASGTGSLDVTNGATATADTTVVGQLAGSSGTLTVDASRFSAGNFISIGAAGEGTFNASNLTGANSLSTGTAIIGAATGAIGTATLETTEWWVGGDLDVGRAGAGTLELGTGASVSVDGATSVSSAGGTGSLVLNGGTLSTVSFLSPSSVFSGTGGVISTRGAVMDVAVQFDATHPLNSQLIHSAGGVSVYLNAAVGDGVMGAGYAGVGSLAVADGIELTSAGGYLGYLAGSDGSASVDGAASSWIASKEIVIGRGGTGTLTVGNGGALQTDAGVTLGLLSGSSGELTVGGTGTTWTSGGSVSVGGAGTGTLNINTGAMVEMNSLRFGDDPAGAGTVNLSGGTLDLNNGPIGDWGGGGASFNFTGGTLRNARTITFGIVQQGGVLAAGNSPGTTQILGDYELQFPGVLEVELAGSGGVAGTDFDFYDIEGNAVLAGVIDVVEYGGFDASPGESFDVLRADSIDTTGAILSIGFVAAVVDDGEGGQILRVSAVPEPSAALFALAAGAVASCRRRRRR